ncbi:hypothetical protein CQW23_16866 [Capsicum baccatum]|uniref:Uncharacterized protein n=1 Tax=Capsicum baccatum TaxID=33114 RepID=A0A2G2WC62_CAPBA|nr:hypothetical protein CQW23_16866 [Capsicum baccatum]
MEPSADTNVSKILRSLEPTVDAPDLARSLDSITYYSCDDESKPGDQGFANKHGLLHRKVQSPMTNQMN